MKNSTKLIFFVLLLLGVLALAGMFVAGRSASVLPSKSRATAAVNKAIVDQQSLQTAKSLLGLPFTAEEEELAIDAVNLADHEVDLAFAAAPLEDEVHPIRETPAIRDARQRIQSLEAQIKLEETRAVELTAKSATDSSDAVQQELEDVEATYAYHQDELESAQQELHRAGGDRSERRQQEWSEHKKSEDSTSAAAGKQPTKPTNYQPGMSLLVQVRQWRDLRKAGAQLEQARAAAVVASQQLTQECRDLDESAEGLSASAVLAPGDKEERASSRAVLSTIELEKRLRTICDKRMEDHQKLASIYGEWTAINASEQRLMLKAISRSALFIVLALLLVTGAEILIERFQGRFAMDRRRLSTMRILSRFATQAVGLALILLVIFGPPRELSTIVALAGAGLTVAMKDFIVAFFGWFALMGRNGIRVGDWVEINGIGGEVVEIGLLRTVLLETGNWNDVGHPTGRKVAFVNSFAIEGHYFNFTTSGQWLWDELEVAVPAGRDPFVLMEEIRGIVTERTKDDAGLAETEWQRAPHPLGAKPFSAAPAIHMRPAGTGVSVVVRYIANAGDRTQVRSRIYQSIIEAMQKRASQLAETN